MTEGGRPPAIRKWRAKAKPSAALFPRPQRMAILEAIRSIKPEPIFLALYGTIPYELARSMGVRVAGEIYADLDYAQDGTTFIKKVHGEIDIASTVAKVSRIVLEGKVTASDGTEIETRGTSVCFHGDNPKGPEIVKAVRKDLESKGVKILPLRLHTW